MTKPIVVLQRDAFIDGVWISSADRFAVRDPATDAVIAEVPSCDDATVDRAIAAAASALPAWRATPAPTRGAIVGAIGRALLADVDRLAALITAEGGKPLAEAAGEIRYAASFFDWFAGEAPRIYGELVPAGRADQRITVERTAVGVCGFITPWNFPAAMLARKLAPALAAGCTVVVKPAELTPLTTLAIAAIAAACGLPAGVLNVVTGDGAAVGGRILADPRVRKISFTGSTAIGRRVLAAAAERVVRASVELGGNAPFVVLADADVDRAVAAAMVAKFRNTGQSCVAANRFIVDDAIAPRFIDALVGKVAALKVGPGAEPGVDLGPVIDDRAVAKLARLVDDAIAQGARLLHGARPGGSRFVAPVVLDGITAAMAIWREEIFGPVIAIRRAAGDDDAIAQANDTDAGLCAYVMSADLGRAERVVARLEVGMAGINEGLISTAQAPFGGVKTSGYGREGSRHGLDDYLDYKYVMTGLAR